MSDLIISFIVTVVFCLVVGGAILLVHWLAGIFGGVIVIPIVLFICLWICAYCALQE